MLKKRSHSSSLAALLFLCSLGIVALEESRIAARDAALERMRRESRSEAERSSVAVSPECLASRVDAPAERMHGQRASLSTASSPDFRKTEGFPVRAEAAQAPPVSPLITTRVDAIAQKTALTQAQRDRLARKFQAEDDLRKEQLSDSERAQREESIEKLEDILGEKDAEEFRKGADEAMQRLRDEQREAQLATLSRKLELSADQEQQVQSALDAVEGEIAFEAERAAKDEPALPQSAQTPELLLRRIQSERRRATELLSERLQGTLTEAQLNRLLELRAASAAVDLGVRVQPE